LPRDVEFVFSLNFSFICKIQIHIPIYFVASALIVLIFK